ncbi:MAG: tetratricopeptide repeat protein [Candidatus Omnitrophota bacterium]
MEKNKPVRLRIPLRQKIILFLFGIFLCAFFLEIGMQIAGSIIISLRDFSNRVSLNRKGAYRILCLGESTTFCGGSEFSYPRQIEEILNKKGWGIKFSVVNKGVGGINTTYILAHLEENIDKYNPDMVIAMMGINDRRDYIPYEECEPPKIIRFLRSLKTYKLSRLIWLHFLAKTKENKVCVLGEEAEMSPANADNQRYPGILETRKNDLEEAIEASPKDHAAYMRLGWFYRNNAKYKQAEETFGKAVELDQLNSSAYVAIGWCYRDQGKYDKAEQVLRQAIALEPDKEEAYILLGCCYGEAGKSEQAEQIFKELINNNPEKDTVYMALGWFYKNEGNLPEAEEAFRTVVKINPANVGAYIELGGCLRDHGNIPAAEEAFKKAVEADPRCAGAYLELARHFRDQKKYSQAEKILKKAIELKLGHDEIYGDLAACYIEQGKYDSAEAYFRQADKLRSGNYNLETHYNYQRMRETLNKKGIKMVCVQYPMRKVDSLKEIFDSPEGILFVDNEKIFKDAVKAGKYEDYFADRFGGDFGHCSRKGNELLAKKIVDVLEKEYFRRNF